MVPGTDGDEAAFEALHARWAPALHRYLCMLLGRSRRSWAEDCLQETFLKARQEASRYNAGHAVSTWLFSIAHNEAMRLHRRERLREGRPLSEAREVPAGPPSPGKEEDLEGALGALPESVRSVLLLVHLQGFTRREAAQAMGLTERQVQDLCHQGFVALRKILKKT